MENELSILVAKIFTLYMLALGVGIATGKLNLGKMLSDIKGSQGLTLAMGFITLVLGALLVNYHNIWVKDWTVLITILAWGVLIKGFLLIAYPQAILSAGKMYKNAKPSFGVVFIIIGLILGYFLFVA